jgi:molybdopterin molybdotransferase
MVDVRLPAALRHYADGSEYLEVEAGTVAEALEAACRRHPDLRVRVLGEVGLVHPHLALFVGERPVEREDAAGTPVAPGDVITVLVGVAGGAPDVRMKGFRDRATVEDALAVAFDGLIPLPAENVTTPEAAGRVLAEAVHSEVDVPPFRRATMDGYAVRAEDTFGATAYSPIVLRLEGSSMPGEPVGKGPGTGGAVRIMTGAPVPDGADAVLRAEDASEIDTHVEVRAPTAFGRNVGRIGEDVAAGSEVLPAGRRLRPADLGLLSAVGAGEVRVHRRPRVRVIVSGDELVPPGEAPAGTKIVDSNSPMLAALIRRDGGEVLEIVRLPDGEAPMREALSRTAADVIVTSGAVSVGREDHTPNLVAELGELPVHGIAMRPSSPTGIGRIGDARVFLLPGNPVSSLVAYDFFAGPAIRVLGGGHPDWPYRTMRLPLAVRLVSKIGRTDYARVMVRDGRAEPLAIGGASVLSSVTRADGFVVVPPGLEGFGEGADVEVGLYGSGP